jgi:phage shock protein E
MKVSAFILANVILVSAAAADETGNERIDMDGYLATALAAAEYRDSRRIPETEFIRMSREPGTIILDARSREKFDELHVDGSIHLSFPDIAVESLAELIPDKTTRILIYCNNNFLNAESPFPSKLPSASLNLSTFIALYNYGYRNIWELGTVTDLGESKLSFVSTPG